MSEAESNVRKLSRGKQLADIKIPGRGHTVIPHVEGVGLSSPVGTVLRQRQAQSPAGSLARGAALHAAVLDLCIYLPDLKGIRFSVDGGRRATASYLSRLVSDHLGLPAHVADETFALWFMSPLLEVQLKSTHVPFHVRRVWPELCRKYTCAPPPDIGDDEPLLVYRRNFRLTKRRQRRAAHKDKLCAQLLYSDAREAYLSGFMPSSLETAVQFAAIDLCINWGPFREGQHGKEAIEASLHSLLPRRFVPQSNTAAFSRNPCSFLLKCARPAASAEAALPPVDAAGQIFERYRALSADGLSAAQLHLSYLHIAMALPCYGAAYFTGQVERPQKDDRWRRSSESADSDGMEMKTMNANGHSADKSREHGGSVSFVKKWLHMSATDTEPVTSDLPIKLAVSSSHVTLLRDTGGGDFDVLMCRELLDCDWRACPEPSDTDSMRSMFLHVPVEQLGATGLQCDTSYLVQVFTKQSAMVVAAMDSCVAAVEHELRDDMAADEVDLPEPPPPADRPSAADLSLCADQLGLFCTALLDAGGNCLRAQGTLAAVLADDDGDLEPSATGEAVV